MQLIIVAVAKTSSKVIRKSSLVQIPASWFEFGRRRLRNQALPIKNYNTFYYYCTYIKFTQ